MALLNFLTGDARDAKEGGRRMLKCIAKLKSSMAQGRVGPLPNAGICKEFARGPHVQESGMAAEGRPVVLCGQGCGQARWENTKRRATQGHSKKQWQPSDLAVRHVRRPGKQGSVHVGQFPALRVHVFIGACFGQRQAEGAPTKTQARAVIQAAELHLRSTRVFRLGGGR